MMKKEGLSDFFNSQNGKVNIVLLFSIVLVFVLSVYFVEALTITINAPGNLSYVGGNNTRNVNFTFTPVWSGPDENATYNCSLYTNSSGIWDSVRNFTPKSAGTNISNNTLSWVNFTFNSEGNFTFNIGCYATNYTSSAALNFSGLGNGNGNRTFFIDTLAPTITLDTPKGGVLADVTAYNITSYETATFYVNVSDNSTQFVWMVLNTNATVTPLAPNPGLNESVNRTMTGNGTGISALDTRQYFFNLSGIMNFNSTFTSPGPHGVSFCANDTLGRLTCTNKSDYIIKGMNVTQMENMFAGMQQGITGFAFGGLNITLGNGTEIPESTFMNPIDGVVVGGLTHKNFTFIFNFSNKAIIHIVAGTIDEDQFANASNSRVNSTPTTEVRQQLGRYTPNMAWADIASFIPNEVRYEYGIIQIGGTTYSKKMYCNGTSMSAPQCHTISQCNATVFGILNHSIVIPPNDGCWLESGVINTQSLSSGYTYIFVDKFSGAVGGEDRGPPNATFISPAASEANHRLNRSTTVTQLINFTVDDTDSTGLNLSANSSINVTITLGGSQVALFSYLNNASTNLTCTSADTVSPQNTTRITCNVTYGFNSNGTYLINVTGRDASNNSNAMNTSSNYVYFTVDQIPPIFIYYNFTNSSNFNTTGTDATASFELGTTAGTSRAQGDANTGRIFAVANWTDNLTDARYGMLQFYNTSKAAGQEWRTLNTTAVNGSGLQFRSGGWTNFSFPIPKGHNNFEGKNVSFRIIANDTLGNVNNSDLVKNFTIQINDTTVPATTINGTISTNNTNTTNTRPLVSWFINDNNKLTSINVSVDDTVAPGTGVESNCQKYAFFDTTAGANNVEKFRNSSFQILDDSACTLANGTHFIRIIAIDSWSNSETVFHNFTVQSGSTPELTLTVLQNGLSAINQSNVTPYTGMNFSATVGATGTLKNMSFTSSCNSTVQTFTNNTMIWPFNYSDCKRREANQTVTVTVFDAAGNFITNTTQFLVDDLGPSLAVDDPTNGFSGPNEIALNLSAKDGNQRISFFGYYLDDRPILRLNLTGSYAGAAANISLSNYTNFTPGTHSIKFTVNDTLGNSRNSSTITFTATGPIISGEIGNSTSGYLTNLMGYPANVTVKLKTSDGSYQQVDANATDVSSTFELLLYLNETSADNQINVTITEINGSGANWDKINFSVLINESKVQLDIQNNWSNAIRHLVYFNSSIDEFLSNANDYYGIVVLPMNVSGGLEIWWIGNESNLSRTNVSACTGGFSATTTTPCFNFTSGGKTIVQVPHFSIVVVSNNSNAPTINVTTPDSAANQSISMFVPNITVSNDAVLCEYSVNGTVPKVTMTKSGNICLGQTERFKNLNALDGNYNFTFNVTDSSSNVNTYILKFNVTDGTAPNTPNSTRISVSESSTSATVTISGMNESVNASITAFSGSSNATSTIATPQPDFNTTQAVLFPTLTASTTYHMNITICDFAGNCATNSTNLAFTTSAAAATTTTTTTTTSAAGGGGAAPTSNVEASAARQWDSIAAGSSGVLAINNEKIAVTGVIIDVQNTVANPSITVESLTSNPLSTAATAAKVYQYLQLRKSNIADSDASKITINFRVPKSWLTSNNVAEDNIVLYRYSDNKWNSLPTTKTGADANNALYQSITPGFSTFAIGTTEAAPAAPIPEAPPEEVPAEVPAEVPVAPTEVPAAPEVKKPALSRTAIAWIVVVIIVIVAAVGYYMWQKRKE
ncbi:PGF-pre-PGF domain-containing protein [Candidatus Woesearchaeota archaeon]|nr:PGF-pre-PGF domain-containing protein [Candidatus Woesearchaeota archaeon]